MEITNKGSKVLLLAGAMLCCASAWAMPSLEPTVTRTEAVKYRPSEANTAEGAAKLYKDLRIAARRVCESQGVNLAPLADSARSSCIQKALDEAVASLGIPMVSAIHQYNRPVTSPAMAASR